MAIVTEDGTGKADAETYISVSDADTYHSDRGNTDWAAATTATKEAALRVATAWIDGSFRRRFPGTKGTKEQALAWPRDSAVDAEGWAIDEDEIPTALKHATAEAALREVQDPGSLSPDLSAAGSVQSERNKAGPVETETVYRSGAIVGKTAFSIIETILSAILSGSKYIVPVLRS